MAAEKIIDLIKKCLALTGSPNENEAARAMEKAQELLRKYNLTIEQVKGTPDAKAMGATIVDQNYDILGRFLWRKELVHAVASFNYCRAFNYVGRSMRDKVSVCGREVNVAATFEMVSWILPQIERLARQAARTHDPYGDNDGEGFVSKQRFRNSFCLGVVDRLRHRFYEVEKQVPADSKALTINLHDEREAWIKAHVSFAEGHTPTGARNESDYGYSSGISAGDNVSLRNYPRLGSG